MRDKNINEMPGFPFDFHAKFTRCFVAGRRIVFGHWLSDWFTHGPLPVCASGESAAELLRNALVADKPCLVSRFGACEMEAVLRGIDIQRKAPTLWKILLMVVGEGGVFWWDNSIKARLCWNAGFFPPTNGAMEEFANLVCKDVSQIDVLGSWLPGEKQLRKFYAKGLEVIPFESLEPFWADNPWTSSLAGKKVLVVHPFEDTIRAQYAKRKLLFKDPNFLPDFELITYRAISSFAGNKVPYDSWFDALAKMCDDISRINFDIAIIGCGAYGMSIGAFIKRNLGKKAFHMGGVTQLLFGIKGARWEQWPKYTALFNEYWVRPFASDTVQSAKTIEGGCYW